MGSQTPFPASHLLFSFRTVTPGLQMAHSTLLNAGAGSAHTQLKTRASHMTYTMLTPPVHGGFKNDLRIHSREFPCLPPNQDTAQHTSLSLPLKQAAYGSEKRGGFGSDQDKLYCQSLPGAHPDPEEDGRNNKILAKQLHGLFKKKKRSTPFIIVPSPCFLTLRLFLVNAYHSWLNFHPSSFQTPPNNLFVYTWKHPLSPPKMISPWGCLLHS